MAVQQGNLSRKRSPGCTFDEDGWKKAWQIKFKYGKSNNLSVWLIDRLTRGEGGHWIDLENGKFELEWIETANAWYAERQRRSKSSQSTHLLYKAIQAAFPNIVEESSEKNKHIFIKRSFRLPPDLCEEIRQIVVGTGTKARAITPTPPLKPAYTGIRVSKSVISPSPRYSVPDTLMKDFMSTVTSSSLLQGPKIPTHPPVTKLVSAWNMDIPTEDVIASGSQIVDVEDVINVTETTSNHGDRGVGYQFKLGSPPMSPSFLKEGSTSSAQEATFEQICEYAKQQLEIIHKWASEMITFKQLPPNDQKALLRSSAPEILVFSICCFSVQNNSGPDYLLLDKDLVISRNGRQFEAAIRNIVSFIIDTIVEPLREILSDRFELSRLRRIILFNPAAKSTHQALTRTAEVRELRQNEHILLQSHTAEKAGRLGELLLLLPPLTVAGNLFVEHLHLEKLVGDTFDNLVAAELLLAMGNG